MHLTNTNIKWLYYPDTFAEQEKLSTRKHFFIKTVCQQGYGNSGAFVHYQWECKML